MFGGIGLIFPALLNIYPKLTAFAAAGLSVIMLLANIFHITREEFFALPVTITLFILMTFIAYGRLSLVLFKKK